MPNNKRKTSEKSLKLRHLPSPDVVKQANLEDLTPEQMQLFLAFNSGIEEARGDGQRQGGWVVSLRVANGNEQICVDKVGPDYQPGVKDLAVSDTRVGILTRTAHAMSRYVNNLVAEQQLAVEAIAPPPIFINGEEVSALEIAAETDPDRLRELVEQWESEGRGAIVKASREALAKADAARATESKTVADTLVRKQIPFDDPIYGTSTLISNASPSLPSPSPSQEQDTISLEARERKKKAPKDPKSRLH